MTTAALQNERGVAPVPSLMPVRSNLLQRKCACGGSPGFDGECDECRKKRLGLQRHAVDQAEPAAVPPIVHEVLRSPGQQLDGATRAFMQSRFGHDFGRVRVHADERAAESARAVAARAYTVGNEIVFGGGQYAPHTAAGQRLLAHEMAHVIQQRGAASGSMFSPALRMGSVEDPSEREARDAEDLLTSSAPRVSPRSTGDKARLRRRPEEEGLKRREPDVGQPGEPLPYKEAMESTERGLYEEYRRDCAGVQVLRRFDRSEGFSPHEEVQRLERKVKNLPGILMKREEKRKKITMSLPAISNRLKGQGAWGPLGRPDFIEPSEQEREAEEQLRLRRDLQEWEEAVIWPKFGRDYVLGSIEDESAKARCELSEARWEHWIYTRTGKLSERRLIRYR
jgi:hypothetical protein